LSAITATLVRGSGTAPKNITVGSYILLQGIPLSGSLYAWELISSPSANNTILDNPSGPYTRVGPLDKEGVYLVYFYRNPGTSDQRIYTIALNVPGTISPVPSASDPLFDSGGRVRNFSFELPGIILGTAADWATEDDAGLLVVGGGVVRGRITPANFTVTSGRYAMCLGDDIGNTGDINVGDEFSISQELDFTDVNTLSLQIKYRE